MVIQLLREPGDLAIEIVDVTLKLCATLLQITVLAQSGFKLRVHLGSLDVGQVRAVRPQDGSLWTASFRYVVAPCAISQWPGVLAAK